MKQYLLSAAMILALGFGVNAQNTVKADYRFAQSNVPYQEERGDTVIATVGDDNVWPNISIGFDFTYNGVTYTKAAVANNGFLAFTTNNVTSSGTGSSILSASIPSGISLKGFNQSGAYGYGPMIAGLNYDLLCDAAVGAGSVLSLTRTGSAPNRKAVFQWKDYRKYGSTHTGDNINFQIILAEASGDVSVHIGPVTYTGNAAHAQSGLRGNDTTDVLSQSGSWSRLGQNTYALDGIYTTANDVPQSGTLFTWSPAPPAAIDVSISSVLRPVSVGGTSCIASATDSVKFNLFNNGTNPVNSVPVSYTVNGGSPITETFTFNPPLASRSSATLTFSSVISLTPAGSTTVRVYSSLAGELLATQRNDTLTKTVTFTGGAGASNRVYPSWTSDFGGRTSNTYPSDWVGESLTGTAQWRVDSAFFDPGSSLSLPIQAVQGPGILFFPSFLNATRGAVNRVSSPCLDLSNWQPNEPAWFVFAMNQDGEYPNRLDSVFVQVAVNGQNFTTVGGFSRYEAGRTTWEWRTFGVDISAYRNQTIRVALVAKSDGGNNLGIDYATVQNTVPVGLASALVAHKVDVYPNPTTGVLNVRLPEGTQYNKIEVLNTLGQVVMQDNTSGISQGATQLNLAKLPKGAYQIRVTGDDAQYQQRVIKQ